MIFAKKSLGQHFLKNQALCQRIARLLQCQPGDQILEIGPGPGALTGEILKSAYGRLLLIEKDDYWAKTHESHARAEVLCQDALAFDWSTLGGAWKLVGNLPYNIASPLIWEILSRCCNWELAVFMVQKEVAGRICALPHSREYGALSVWVQAHAKVKLQFVAGPGNFAPPPKVDSAVVSFWPAPERPKHPEALKLLLKTCFQKRRKQLGNILAGAAFGQLLAALPSCGLEPRFRPEDLSVQNYIELSGILAEQEHGSQNILPSTH